jgi:hypothetical protein
MSVNRGFVICLRSEDTTTVYVKPDKCYTVDLLRANLYPTRESAAEDFEVARLYGEATRVKCVTSIRPCTVMAALDNY